MQASLHERLREPKKLKVSFHCIISMSNFITQCDVVGGDENIRRGENNSIEHISTKSALLDLFFQLVRGADVSRLSNYIDNICHNAGSIEDLFVLLFQTRDCRGGKGEKELFYRIIIYLYEKFPDRIDNLLELIPTYGYYKDYWNILSIVYESIDSEEATKRAARLKREIFAIYSRKLFEDANEIRNNPENPVISLAAKYSPREQHEFATKHNALFCEFVRKYMFPRLPHSQQMWLYRKLIVGLNRALQVTEVYMCAKRYSEIDFTRVPSLCLSRFRKAFLNELCHKRGHVYVPMPMDEEKGNRFPDDPDRVAARQNLKRIMAGAGADTGTIKAKQLMPHEIVENILDFSKSKSEVELFQSQWDIIRDNASVRGNFIPIVDVSSSMNGTPMLVAIALGLLISETTNLKYRNKIITFSESPAWVSLEGVEGIVEKVSHTRCAPWGGSTNFAKAMDMILDVVIDNDLSPSEVPDLIVFSDMQFDEADSSYNTHYQRIEKQFHDAGMDILGEPYPVPRIVFWNLRATNGFPVTCDTNNTMMLSGFSPALMKAFLKGDEMEVITPLKTLDDILYDERYDPVRARFRDAGLNERARA